MMKYTSLQVIFFPFFLPSFFHLSFYSYYLSSWFTSSSIFSFLFYLLRSSFLFSNFSSLYHTHPLLFFSFYFFFTVLAPLNLTAAQTAISNGMGNEAKIDNAIQTIMRLVGYATFQSIHSFFFITLQ